MEGILLIVGLYVVSGILGMLTHTIVGPVLIASSGPTFWDTPALTFTGLEKIPFITKYVPNKGLNEFIMAFGAVVLAFNIITR